MTRSRALAGAFLAALLPGLLVTGAVGGLPDVARLTLAFVSLLVLPGAAFVVLGVAPPGGAWTAPGWAFGFSVAWCAAQLFVSRLVGGPFLALAAWSPLACALPWLLVVARGPREAAAAPRSITRWAGVVVLLAAAFAAWHSARFGPPMGLSSDTPDHVGTLRRMLETGDLFPTNAFFRDAGALGADPRKGLWHGEVALLCRLAGLDPVVAWRALPALVVPLFVLAGASLGVLVRGSSGAALAAWALVLTYGASMAQSPIRQAAFASRMGDHLALATTVAVLADLRAPRRATRLAAAALGFAAAAAHVFAVIQFAMMFAALGVGLLLRDRRFGAEARRLAGTGLLVALACLPYVLFRARQAYAPSNPIHLESQGLLFVTDTLRTASIGELWAWMGIAWVLVPLAWPWLWSRGRANSAVLYLFTASVAVALVMYDPLAVALLEPRIGYLLMRMIWLVPFAGILAWLLPELVATAWRSPHRTARGWSAAFLALALALLAPAVLDALHVLAHPDSVTAAERAEDPRRWQDAFGWMREHLEPGQVVLSDPATSYAVPMLTGLFVVTLVDQHSSPNDSLALRRILDARDALDPYASWATTREVVRRYGVGAIVLNDRFAQRPQLDYWAPGHAWFRAARARFDARLDAFEPAFDTGDLVVYRVRVPVLDTMLAAAPRRPGVEPWAGATTRVAAMGPGLPVVAGFALDRSVASRGDTVHGVLAWHAERPAPAGAYSISVRFDRDLPPGFDPPTLVRKPVRKLLEHLRHERYRFREDHLPVAGQYGVDLWRSDELVRDSFTVRVPTDVADGSYRVQVRMHRQPHYPNLSLRDYFVDDDYFSGVPVGTLVVGRAPKAGAGVGRH